MANPFEFVEAAGYSKVDLFETRGAEEKDYMPFLVNRAFSYHLDSITYANIANVYLSGAPAKSQFHFYLHTLDKKKRFSKWAKPDEDEMLGLVMKQFNYNIEKAKLAMSVLTPDDLAELKSVHSTGGKLK